MVNLIGTYECKADVKGRLMLPSPLKKQLSSILQDGFVLKRSVFQPCLELYSTKIPFHFERPMIQTFMLI